MHSPEPRLLCHRKSESAELDSDAMISLVFDQIPDRNK
jgi:hypothetical protein